jgi:hypothetical protein
MIITKEMFDEFVESAENHTILWTDTLALIGVTVGDVPDVDVIGELEAEIEKLRKEQADEIAAWEKLYDAMMDVRFEIQDERDAARAENARLREAIAGPAAWLDSWAQHVGNCQGGYICTCGLVRARSELSAALAQETQS